MDKKSIIVSEIRDKGLLPLYYHSDKQVSIEILKALFDAGVRAVEYTNRGPAALENFAAMKIVANKKLPGMFLGIGTIKNAGQAKDFVNAGADFIISPGIPASVANFMVDHEIFWIPGCMTPTEIMFAEEYNLKFVKLFPANLLGPSFLKSIKELFPQMEFMPTGGVGQTNENINEWFASGVSAIGMGSNLISKQAIRAFDYEQIKANTLRALHSVESARKLLPHPGTIF